MSTSTIIILSVSSMLASILAASSQYSVEGSKSPHIVFILADDLGWNDVGFHGLDQIPTPNIDALAYSGIMLKNYYTTQLCTPSRSAIMTGKHAIHTGMQHNVLYGCDEGGLPLSEKILPEYLKELGYRTRIVGKWHLGFYKKEYTPTYRGFESHLGYWTGHQDYFDHSAEETIKATPMWGLDMRRNMDPAWDLHGKYSTEVFTTEAVDIIHNHNKTEPLFLYLAHAATHSANSYDPLQAPAKSLLPYTHIDDYRRSKFAGMLHELDESVGRVVEALQKVKMLDNSIIVFVSDNGGAAAGFNLNAASNWPLRGGKNTLWEGGVKGVGLIWSPLLESRGIVAEQYIHVSDWLPTLVSAVKSQSTYSPGQNISASEISNTEVDGIDEWNILSKNEPSKRKTILHNIDDDWRISALTHGKWKLIKGRTYNGSWDGWYGPSGRHGDDNSTSSYDTNRVINSRAGKAVLSLGFKLDGPEMLKLRASISLTCGDAKEVICEPQMATCLFDIHSDPCEKTNLADRYPDVLSQMEKYLVDINGTAVKPIHPHEDAKRGDPKHFHYAWTNFGDY